MSVPWRCPVNQPEAMTGGWLPQVQSSFVARMERSGMRERKTRISLRSIRATAPSSRLRAIGREQVAGPAHRADDGRPRRIRLDLLADAGDTHVDGAVEGFAVACFGEVKEALACEHALGVLGERFEQGKLGARERVLVAALVAQHARLAVEPFGRSEERRVGNGCR